MGNMERITQKDIYGWDITEIGDATGNFFKRKKKIQSSEKRI